ncbi:DUF559 domain-containing protein [Paenibacillus lupini]|uniref:endonuclease domain-containing protein n=1 Tax=Paenibacillus lupini TaxID=1450204 RepID=UPI001421EE9B|nr:DUF559 domain-containing protein [Paenibacillus lupini]NIK22047.1 very-short-patch-repair endonuclease [Paenibacillus lupini]
MGNFTALERVMGDALLKNNLLFYEQVYTKTEVSYFIFDIVVYGETYKIVVECDGPFHNSEHQQIKDSLRDLWTIQNGIQSVLRFEQFEIYRDVQKCIEKIKKELHALDAALCHDKSRVEKIAKEKRELILRNRERYSESPYSNKRVQIWRAEDAERKRQRNWMETHAVSRSTGNLITLPPKFPENNYPNYEAAYKNTSITNDQVKPRSIEQQIPNGEQSVLLEMKKLAQPQKRLLMKFIKNSNKDGICTYRGNLIDIQDFIKQGFIVPNRMNQVTFFVLPNTPYLFKALKNG